MSEATLYLRLADDATHEAVWQGSDGASGRGALAEVAPLTLGRRVVVFVAGADVLLLDALVPTRKRERLYKAVPFALEERLVADVETLHFAFGRSAPNPLNTAESSVAVAVVARTRMDAWLAALAAAGIVPNSLIPDVLALPLAPQHWTLLQEPTTALLRTGLQSGLALAPEWLPLALGEAALTPDGICVVRDVSAPFHDPLPTLALPTLDLPCPNGVLALLIEGYRPLEAINLLQGAYQRSEPLTQLWQPWRIASILLVALIVLQFVILVLDERQLAAEDVALQKRMKDIYTQTFPDARRLVNPRVQMEQRLNALRAEPEGESGNLLEVLARLAPVLGATQGAELHSLRYKEEGMELDLSITNLQLLDQLKRQLVDAGLDAEVRTARAAGESVDAILQIRGTNKKAQ